MNYFFLILITVSTSLSLAQKSLLSLNRITSDQAYRLLPPKKFLNAYKAISIKEIMFGATHYEAKKISCYYSLDNQPYYKCNSGVDVFF